MIMKLIMVTLCLIATCAYSQSLEWANQINGHKLNPLDMVFDPSGNVYICGSYTGDTDFDAGSGTYILPESQVPGTSDIFIAKYDPNGQIIWAQNFGSPGFSTEYGNFITRKSNGNIVIVGTFFGTIDFDPGPGVFSLSPTSGTDGYIDTYILELDENGNFVWASHFNTNGGPQNFHVANVIIDEFDNIYLAASFYGNHDVDPGPGVAQVQSSSTAWVTLKLSNSGNLIWHRLWEMQWFSTIFNLGSFEVYEGHIYIGGNIKTNTGNFENVAPLPFSDTITTSDTRDGILVKMDTSGTYLWHKIMDTPTSNSLDITNIVGIKAMSNGDFILNGYTLADSVEVDLGNGTYYVDSTHFTQRIDSSGNLIWIKLTNSRTSSFDANDNLYFTLPFNTTTDFGLGALATLSDTTTSSFNGKNDIAINILSPNGNFLENMQLHGYFDSTVDIEISPFGKVYLSGNLLEGDVDPSPLIQYFSAADTAGTFVSDGNGYILKIGMQNAELIDSETFNTAHIYPSPFENSFSIDFGKELEYVEVAVTDLSGKVILNKSYSTVSHVNLNLNSVSGIYLVHINSGGKKYCFKLLKK